jgi:3-dehydroquinate dehydratase / shikimate dehydrogenase
VATIRSWSRASEARNGLAWKLADWLEIRADLMREPMAVPSFNGRLLYSLRSCRAGGEDDSPIGTRHRRLREAARCVDLVDLEGEQDLVPKTLTRISPERRVISWYGQVRDEQTLHQLLRKFSRTEALLYRFEITCSRVEEATITLQFLNRAKRPDVIAYAAGSVGVWTRVLAPRFGAPFVFGGLGEGREDQAGNPTVFELVEDYGFPQFRAVNELFAIVGEPISGSLSPRLHNAAHLHAGAGRVFLSFPTSAFESLWNGLVSSQVFESMGLTLKGLTVASPNKQTALGFSGRAALLCRKCRASNLLVRQNETWRACTTEPYGIFCHMAQANVNLSGSKAAVIGCGGSGRVTAAALACAGAQVTLVNRSSDRGKWANRLLGLPFVPLKEFSPRGYSVIVNATSVGRNGEELPIELTKLNPGSLVVDLVYTHSGTTPLVTAAHALGHTVIEGRKVLLAQTMRQYALMTGETMPESLVRGLLWLRTNGNDASVFVDNDHPNARQKAELCKRRAM